ncbi:MAG: D-alanyl-alanine synthetase [Alphaproteobacteria bacterium]
MAVQELEARPAATVNTGQTFTPPRRTGRIGDLREQIDRLRSRLRIAVIYGGDKSAKGTVIHPTFNARPWKSYQVVAKDIANALERLGCEYVTLFPEDMRLAERLQHEKINIAWLNSGGVQGYNPVSHAAAMLEMLGIPYVGHDPLTAGMLDNKHVFKRELLHLNFPTVPFMTWHLGRGPFQPKVNTRFIQTFRDYWGPFVVKPVSGRASLHVHLVENEADLPDVVAAVYEATGNHVMIESYLAGHEYCMAVSGPVVSRGRQLTRSSEPFVFSAIERLFEPDEKIFTSMDVRPIKEDRFRLLDPVADATEMETLYELARKVFLEIHLESIVRLDIRADEEGRMYVIEANPKPDLKKPSAEVTSLVCAGLADHDMDYDDLILSILADSLDLLFSQRRGAETHLTHLLE